MNQRYCRSCGAEVQDDDRYCSECGHRIDAAAGESDQHGTGARDTSDSGDGWGADDDGWGSSRDADAGETQSGQQTGRGEYRGGDQPDTTMAAITHVLALFTWVIGPAIVYIAADDPFVRENAANATNWQIMFTLYMLVSVLLVVVLVGFVLLFVLPILDMALIIVGALKASEGEAWKYPLTPDIV